MISCIIWAKRFVKNLPYWKSFSAHPLLSFLLLLQLFNLAPIKVPLSVGEEVLDLVHVVLRHVPHAVEALVAAAQAHLVHVALVVDRPLLLFLLLVLFPQPE